MNTAMNFDETDIVLVPDAAPGKNIGLQIHWRLAGTIDRETFNAALESVLPSNLLPTAVSPTTALRRAMASIRGARSSNLVRLVEKGKYSIVNEKSDLLDLDLIGDHESAYHVIMNAEVVYENDLPVVKVTPSAHPQKDALVKEFNSQLTKYHAGLDLSQWLSTKIVPAVNGVSGRDRGGFYFIPAGEDTARLQEIVEKIQSVSLFDLKGRLVNGVKLYCVPAVLSKDMAEAVLDGITEEVDGFVDMLNQKIHDNELSLRSWATQRKNILAMENKVDKFSKLLGVSMSHITEHLETAQNNIGYIEAKLEYEKEQAEKASNK